VIEALRPRGGDVATCSDLGVVLGNESGMALTVAERRGGRVAFRNEAQHGLISVVLDAGRLARGGWRGEVGAGRLIKSRSSG
jgi:hypothetical protein